MSTAVTMKTIAAKAGVTQATVSMSLAGNPRIPLATRERIREIAEKLGYRPNAYVSTLMRLRRQGKPLTEKPVLAVVCAYRTADGWKNNPAPTIRQQREGALERAALRGYRAQEFWLHREGMSNERFSEMLRARGIHGVLLGPLAEGDAAPELRWDFFAAVSLSVPHPSLTLTTVCNDHYFSSLQAVRECARRGYRRPGIILHRTHQNRFQGRWLAGYLVAGELVPQVSLAKPLLIDDWTDEAAVLGWLRREKPDAIITPSKDTIAPLLTRRGIKIPRDLGFALLACPGLNDAFSGVFQNGHRVGALAVDTLAAMLERHERGLPTQATTVMVEGLWNEGSTLPARR